MGSTFCSKRAFGAILFLSLLSDLVFVTASSRLAIEITVNAEKIFSMYSFAKVDLSSILPTFREGGYSFVCSRKAFQ
jgi:hypothetical protein